MSFSLARSTVFASLAASVLLAGCGTLGATVPVEGAASPRTSNASPSDIAIYATGTPPQPYMIVGFLAVDAPTSEEALAELRRRAALLGGDAIVALDVSLGGFRGVHATGAAVRYS
jgi:hypothetical protein